MCLLPRQRQKKPQIRQQQRWNQQNQTQLRYGRGTFSVSGTRLQTETSQTNSLPKTEHLLGKRLETWKLWKLPQLSHFLLQQKVPQTQGSALRVLYVQWIHPKEPKTEGAIHHVPHVWLFYLYLWLEVYTWNSNTEINLTSGGSSRLKPPLLSALEQTTRG